jgi:uncharacterized repeat protein (TIGR03803 family)
MMILATLFILGVHSAGAQESILYSFGTPGCVAQPDDAPVFDSKGNIYGTCLGPQPNGGYVYELSPATGGNWTWQNIFPFDNIGDNATGDQPNGLAIDSKGNLYGTTSQGGANNTGVVFELSHGSSGWTETILHNFGPSEGGDGATPLSGVILDATGNLYGTTSAGGPNFGVGTAYQLSPGTGGVWTETFLHTFSYVDLAGSGPTGRLTFDAKGDLYGMTPSSGDADAGAVFKLAPQGAGVWTASILYTFGLTNTTDAINPVGALVFDGSGNLYGASNSGGINSEGLVFKLSPISGGGVPWTETLLHQFNDDGTDGVNPVGGVSFDAKGNLYGTTSSGGADKGIFGQFGYGTIYEIAAAATAPKYKVVYNFDYALNDTDGFHPYSNPVFDASGNLYGTSSGGSDAAGAVYELASTTPTAATPVFAPAAGTYTPAQTVTISDATSGATIYYTTNGSTPTTSSTKYTGAITVSVTETLEAIAVASGEANSTTASATYTIQAPTVATPIYSPAVGTYTSALSVMIMDSTAGAKIYYTINGKTPTTASTRYTGAITVSATETIEAIAVASGYTNSAIASATYTIKASTASGLQFIAVTPCRIADTRNTTGAFGGPELAAAATRTFNVPQSACGIPSTAVAYSLNVTVVPIQSLGYLTIWPAGEAQPIVSTLNSDGRVKANATITPAGTNGGVSVYASDATQFILDIDGYFIPAGTSASGLEFYPLAPCRVADTRNPIGALGGPSLTGGAGRAFPVQSSACGIPSTAKAYSLNITVVPHGSLGYLTTWPTGQAQPVVSTLNSSSGAVTANAAIVPAGSGGEISVFVSDTADVILDVDGYFAPPATGGLSLYTVTPCRALDTRSSSGAFDGTLIVPVHASACVPPSTAQAYVLNATVVPTASLSYLTLWAAGGAQPDVSTLNASDGAVTSNMAIVPTANGSVDAFSTNSTQLILDLSSYFAP